VSEYSRLSSRITLPSIICSSVCSSSRGGSRVASWSSRNFIGFDPAAMSAWVTASASRNRTEGASACFQWLPCQYAAEAVSSAPKSVTIHEM
jgi:hypothetical protein